MMKLERMKERKPAVRRNGLRRLTSGMALTFLVPTLLMSCSMGTPVYAESESGNPAISIEKPSGWKQGSTTVAITVDASAAGEDFSIAKIEARTGNDSGWQDVTAGKTITINGNQTVYVRVTDAKGNVYEQNRSIKCYDDEKPTLSASLSDGVLKIKGNDGVSGIASFTVNGATYTELNNGELKIQLTQKDFTTKKIEITATDTAGNVSETYSLQNPYYEWAVQQAQAQAQAQSSDNLSTTTSGTASTEPTTAPLPQDAQASEPTEARGTVDERTVTGIEEELAESGESAETIQHTATEGTKEFYVITTKSGKGFYLIVDNSKSEDNVYLLTEVSEKDLMNFTLSDTVTLPDVGTVYAEVEKEETPTPIPETEKQEETEDVKMPEESNPIGSYLLIGLIALGGLGAGYYFKIYKPKNDFEEEDEYEGEEDEPEEKRELDDNEKEEEPSEPEEVLEDDEEE